MTKAFYFPFIVVAILFAIGWFIQGHFSHTSGKTLILQTTSADELKKIRSELTFIVDHRADIKLPESKQTHSLASLHKISIRPVITDSSQIRDARDLSVTWNTWKVRQLNAKLVSEPVYFVQNLSSDTTHP
jgi:hypothetical protein